jgi:hypothetical protein
MVTKRGGMVGLAVLLGLGVAQALAQAPTAPVPPAGPTLDLRLRSEWVDDAAFAASSRALTARVRAGYRTPVRAGWRGVVELEHTSHLGAEHFNSTANGRTAFPAIADPDNTELNQAYLLWSPSPSTRLAVGRQRLAYDNQRFIGNSGWRQNEQTFDAVDWQQRAGPLQLRYSWLDRVQRANGADNPNRALARWQLDAHLFNAAGKLGPGTLTGYAYFIENQTLPGSSHRDVGLRYALRRDRPDGLGWSATAELARQRPHADGAAGNRAEYALLEGALAWQGHAFKAGVERLGGDGRYGFATPLATLHAFNGWADRFTTTPAAGLVDRYAGWSRRIGKLDATVVAHRYRSDAGGQDLGRELDASLGWAIRPRWTALAKWADYRAGDTGGDLRKAWLSLEYVR